jgi:hypothetical protein
VQASDGDALLDHWQDRNSTVLPRRRLLVVWNDLDVFLDRVVVAPKGVCIIAWQNGHPKSEATAPRQFEQAQQRRRNRIAGRSGLAQAGFFNPVRPCSI